MIIEANKKRLLDAFEILMELENQGFKTMLTFNEKTVFFYCMDKDDNLVTERYYKVTNDFEMISLKMRLEIIRDKYLELTK